jgi:ABC-type transport system substrate-binding protein
MKKFLFIALAIILITGLFVVIYNKLEAASGEAKYGGRLKLVGGSNVSNMGNPDELSNPGDAGLCFTACEGLMTLDAKGNLKPQLAEKWAIAPDGKSVTFYLRKGVKFHDGSDFNAESAKYNMDIRIKTKAWANFHTVMSAEALDKYTIKFNFKDKFDWVAMNSLAAFFSGMEFSMKALKTNTPEWLRSHPVGTGPFKLADYARDQYVKFDRFDEYWGGKPYLDGVDYMIIPDPTTALLAFKKGEVHGNMIQPQDAAGVKGSGFQVIENNSFVFNLALIPDSNNPKSPFSDIRVRRAFEYAIDKKSLADALGYGYFTVINQPFIPSQPYYNPNVVGYPYNPKKAKALLAEAGYPKGFTTKILMVDFMPLDMPIAVQDMCKEVGITIEFDRVSLPQFSFKVGQGWEGLAVGGVFAGPFSDPGNTLKNGMVSQNTTWVSNNEPQEIIDLALNAASELDPKKRAAIYQKLSKKATDDYAMWCFMYFGPMLFGLSDKVKGHTIGQGTFPYTHAWLEK